MNRSLSKFIFISLSILIFSIHCKKKKENPPPSLSGKVDLIGYVIHESGIPVYSGPDLSGKPIERIKNNSSLKIVGVSIPDSVRKNIFWYQIDWNGKLVYVLEDEEKRTKNPTLSIFRKIKEKTFLVRATSLRLRKVPSLTGEVLESLPTNTELVGLSTGSTLQSIDGKVDHWLQVKSPSGKIGFCFSGFLIEKKDFSASYSLEDVVVTIELGKDVRFVKEPGSDENAPENLASDTDHDPNTPDEMLPNHIFSYGEGSILPVSRKAVTESGEGYYLIEHETLFTGMGVHVTQKSFGWVSEKNTTPVENLMEHTYKKYGFNDLGEKDFYTKVLKDFSDKDIQSFELSYADPNKTYLLLKENMATVLVNYETPVYTIRLFQKIDGDYNLLSTIETDSGGGDLQFHDFNEDGYPDLVRVSFGRMESYYDFQVFENDSFVSKLTLNTSETDENGLITESEISFSGNSILVNYSNGSSKVYEYKEDQFVESDPGAL